MTLLYITIKAEDCTKDSELGDDHMSKLFRMISSINRAYLRFINKSISRRIAFSFIPLFVACILMISFFYSQAFSGALKKQIIDYMNYIIQQEKDDLDFYFGDVKNPLVMVAENAKVVDALTHYSEMNIKDQVHLKREIVDFTRTINVFKDYLSDIIIVGRNGFVLNVGSSPTLLSDYDFLNAEWMRPVTSSTERGIYFIPLHDVDYYYSYMPNQKTASAVLPVIINNSVIGYVICEVNYQKINVSLNNSFSEGGTIFISDESGVISYHTDSKLIGSHLQSGLMNQIHGRESGSFKEVNEGKSELFVFSRSKTTGWILGVTIPYRNILQPGKEVMKSIYWILLACLILVFLVSYLLSMQIKKPLNMLITRMETVKGNDFVPRRILYGYGEIAVLGNKFEIMVKRINALIQDVYETNVKQKDMEFKMLKSQINPHFLYNALQLIKTEAVLTDNKEISSIVTALGHLLRYTLDNRSETVHISDEVHYTRYFLDIYKKRFENKFNYWLDVAPDLETCKIPKLILQPIVENCLKHGFRSVKNGGLIKISIFSRNGELVFQVFDNGTGMDEKELLHVHQLISHDLETENIGLRNIHQRIRIKYGDEYGLKVESKKGEFTQAELILPISKESGDIVV